MIGRVPSTLLGMLDNRIAILDDLRSSSSQPQPHPGCTSPEAQARLGIFVCASHHHDPRPPPRPSLLVRTAGFAAVTGAHRREQPPTHRCPRNPPPAIPFSLVASVHIRTHPAVHCILNINTIVLVMMVVILNTHHERHCRNRRVQRQRHRRPSEASTIQLTRAGRVLDGDLHAHMFPM